MASNDSTKQIEVFSAHTCEKSEKHRLVNFVYFHGDCENKSYEIGRSLFSGSNQHDLVYVRCGETFPNVVGIYPAAFSGTDCMLFLMNSRAGLRGLIVSISNVDDIRFAYACYLGAEKF